MVLTNYWIACIYTIIVMVCGTYIVLNLFLAILLANLDQLEFDEPTTFMESTIVSMAGSFATRMQRVFLLDKMR